jgi:transcription elongation factor Elf1
MNLQYHIHKSKIKCPYCDHEQRDDDGSVDQDVSEFECGNCEKVFWVEMNILYSTHSDCALNRQEHKWINDVSDKYPQIFNCENCSQYEVRKLKKEPI